MHIYMQLYHYAVVLLVPRVGARVSPRDDGTLSDMIIIY